MALKSQRERGVAGYREFDLRAVYEIGCFSYDYRLMMSRIFSCQVSTGMFASPILFLEIDERQLGSVYSAVLFTPLIKAL